MRVERLAKGPNLESVRNTRFVLSSLARKSSTLLAQVCRRAKVSGTPWLLTSQSLKSSAYKLQARESCLILAEQVIASALALDLDKAGRSIAARIAMMAMTTNSSIS